MEHLAGLAVAHLDALELLARPEEIVPWHGETPVKLDNGRYFCVIGALCDGHFATFDTETSELIPFRIATAGLDAPCN